MKRIILCLALTGCADTSVQMLAGHKTHDGGFYGDGPTVTLRLQKEVNSRIICEYEHVSHLLVGPPFGPKHEEDSLNQISCGIGIEL